MSYLAPQQPITLTTSTFNSSSGVLNWDMLSNSASGWYDTQNQFGIMLIDIYTTTTVTGGVLTFEQTQDKTSDATGITINLQDLTVLTQTNVTTLTLAASTIKHYQAPITGRYIRFRFSTAFAGTGNVGATINFKTIQYSPLVYSVNQATAASLATTATIASGTVTTVSSVLAANLNIPGIVADVASAALATTTTTATLTPTFGPSYQVNIPVTVVSGSSPTLDVEIQESADTGTNWYAVYDFPRITATGSYNSPVLMLTGNRVRYVQTVAGSSPSFTRAINRLQSSQPVTQTRQIVDRTITLTSTNSTTPSLNVANCKNAMFTVNIGAATIAPILQLQGSDDNGANWYTMGTTLTSIASSTVSLTVPNINAQLIRVNVQTGGSVVTAGYVLVRGF